MTSEAEQPNDEGGGMTFAMPFVTVRSQGGPHDDGSYVAGAETGQLSTQLACAAAIDAIPAPPVRACRQRRPGRDLAAAIMVVVNR